MGAVSWFSEISKKSIRHSYVNYVELVSITVKKDLAQESFSGSMVN